jgi:hypothetical protein
MRRDDLIEQAAQHVFEEMKEKIDKISLENFSKEQSIRILVEVIKISISDQYAFSEEEIELITDRICDLVIDETKRMKSAAKKRLSVPYLSMAQSHNFNN